MIKASINILLATGLLAILILAILAATGQHEGFLSWFRAFDVITPEGGQALALSVAGAVLAQGVVAGLWRWRSQSNPKSCAALNPKFDPRASFVRALLLGLFFIVVALVVGGAIAGEPSGWLVLGICFVICATLHIGTIFVIAAPSCRRAWR